ncbi:MAG: hypothetical protein LBJ88_04190 [Campylobacteraceae bacterium]|jgi:hypothetical protein|nr:hypothetical protein [Campylobacteraceae bacterium]
MKKIISVLAIVLMTSTVVFADKALDDELIDNVCNLAKVKELIAKGANKNVMLKKDQSLYAYAAKSKSCGDSAHYLSSIGAVDVGAARYIGYESSAVDYYPSNRMFEDKRRLKVTINDVGLGGYSSDVTLENKDGDVYILSITVDVDGVKFLDDLSSDKSRFSISPNSAKKFHLYFNPTDTNKRPKIVNNKVSYTRQVTIKYSLDGDIYELKSPKMKEDIDVKYQNYVFDPFSL